jgi:hypothetical protein
MRLRHKEIQRLVKVQMKPNVFIGSSAERLDEAHAIQSNLEHYATAVVWPQDVTRLSDTILDSLVSALDDFDAAVFVFAPDDPARIRENEVKVVRDNVVFELGLFMGRLGKGKCFIVTPRSGSKAHIPTDLVGVTPAIYNENEKNLQAALGPACTQIRKSLPKTNGRTHLFRDRMSYFLRGVKETYMRYLMEIKHREDNRPPNVGVRLNVMLPSAGSPDKPNLKIHFVDYLNDFKHEELYDLWKEDQGKAGVAWETKTQQVYAADIRRNQTRFEKMGTKSQVANQLKSVISTPVFLKEEIIGLLNLDSFQGGRQTLVHTEQVGNLLRDAAYEIAPLLMQCLR